MNEDRRGVFEVETVQKTCLVEETRGTAEYPSAVIKYGGSYDGVLLRISLNHEMVWMDS